MGDQNTTQVQLPNSPFDRLPDEAIHVIFNKVQDAKTLLRCLSLNKRFASIIPQTDTVSLSLVLPRKQNNNNDNNNPTDGNSVNIVKSAVNYLIAKLLRRGSGDSSTDSLCQRLRAFSRIKHLHLELHTDGVDVTDDFLKWKATYGSEFKTCAMLCALSIRRLDAGEPSRAMMPSSTYQANDELRWRKKWLSSCMTAASERHRLVKRMLARFPTLETVTITDAKRQGTFSMAEGDVRDLRESLKQEGASTELSPERVMPKFLLRMWYATELELPVVGCLWKEAMLLVMEPVDGDGETVSPAENRGDGGFDCDAEEKAMLTEARREILNSRKSLSYTWVL